MNRNVVMATLLVGLAVLLTVPPPRHARTVDGSGGLHPAAAPRHPAKSSFGMTRLDRAVSRPVNLDEIVQRLVSLTIELLEPTEDPFHDGEILLAEAEELIRSLSAGQVRELLAMLDKDPRDWGLFRPNLYAHWASLDPRAAHTAVMALAEEWLGNDLQPLLLFAPGDGTVFTALYEGWARTDAAGALAQLEADLTNKALVPPNDSTPVAAIVSELARQDPGAAWELVITDDAGRGFQYFESEGRATFRAKVIAFLEAVEGHQDWSALAVELELRARVFHMDSVREHFAARWMESDPAAALHWHCGYGADHNLDPDAAQQAGSAAARWHRRQSVEAVQWVREQVAAGHPGIAESFITHAYQFRGAWHVPHVLDIVGSASNPADRRQLLRHLARSGEGDDAIDDGRPGAEMDPDQLRVVMRTLNVRQGLRAEVEEILEARPHQATSFIISNP